MVFTDNMKKESRLYLVLMICCAIIMIAFPVSFYFVVPETPLWQLIIVAIWFFVLFLLCLYAFLYSVIYNVKFSSDVICYKSLFRKKTINIKNIISYKFLRYYKTGFYQYEIKYDTEEGIKIIKLSTKHQQDLIKLFGSFQIKEII